jgi:hypothetical protein
VLEATVVHTSHQDDRWEVRGVVEVVVVAAPSASEVILALSEVVVVSSDLMSALSEVVLCYQRSCWCRQRPSR